LSQHNQKRLLTAAEIEIRIWAIVVLAITAILFFIVVALIYRTTFVEQPIKQISPLDIGDQKMMNDIVLLLVGAIGGVAMRKGVKDAAEMIAAVQRPTTPTSTYTPGMSYGGLSMPNINVPYVPMPNVAPSFVSTRFDKDWTPPPPPTNPPHYLEPDEDRAAIAAARESTRGE
jgi:hypothetical protein